MILKSIEFDEKQFLNLKKNFKKHILSFVFCILFYRMWFCVIRYQPRFTESDSGWRIRRCRERFRRRRSHAHAPARCHFGQILPANVGANQFQAERIAQDSHLSAQRRFRRQPRCCQRRQHGKHRKQWQCRKRRVETQTPATEQSSSGRARSAQC